jgi:hypothetical protein
MVGASRSFRNPEFIIIIFVSSITSIETCYARYKTESFHLFQGLPKFIFPFGWYFKIILGPLCNTLKASRIPSSWLLAKRMVVQW